MVISSMASSDFSPGFLLDFASSAYTIRYSERATDRMRSLLFHHLLSQHPVLPTPEGSSRLHFRFFAASMAFTIGSKARLPLFPIGLTFRRCKIHFMLRAVASLSLLRRLQRFSTPGHPDALVACYLAA